MAETPAQRRARQQREIQAVRDSLRRNPFGTGSTGTGSRWENLMNFVGIGEGIEQTIAGVTRATGLPQLANWLNEAPNAPPPAPAAPPVAAGLRAPAAAAAAVPAITLGGAATGTRGYRNNNPGNIEDGSFARSLPGYAGSDGRFAKFDSIDNGRAAQSRLINSYISRGFDTPAKIINRWAPPSDNNPTSTYAQYVAGQLGIGLNDRVSPAQAAAVAAAIERFENGGHSGGTAGPNLSAPSPNDLMQFIPNPRQIRNVDLPDAIQLEAPQARPEMELANKEAMLADLTAAMQITPRDRTGDAWERIQGMLQGAASGMAQAGPEAAVAQLLLAGGGAGLAGFREEREDQRVLDREETEAERQVKIALARMGYDIDAGNLDTRNQNRTINWQSGEDARGTRNQNRLSADERILQELQLNLGIDQANIGAFNQADMARGQVGAGALQNQFAVGNQSAAAGWEADQQYRLLGARTGATQGPGARLLLGLGLSPERSPGETPEVALAREAAGQIETQGGTAGVPYLASEIIQRGLWDNPNEFPQEVIDQVRTAIDQEKPEAARLLIMRTLQSDPTALSEMVKELAASKSSLVAQMMVP